MDQKEFIKEFKFKKQFGQNFIIDENILNNIVKAVNVDKNNLVIEVGCGAGALTNKLIKNFDNVIGYEIDSSLRLILKKLDNENENVEIIFDDFLKRNIKKDLEKYKYENLYLVANLPYYITTPIIMKIIDSKINIKKIVIMVQKEVGNRLKAKPNSKEYNSLSVFIEYYFNVKKIIDVNRNVFVPKPNVDSIVIELSKKEKKHNVLDEQLFFNIVRDSFRQKRKTLKNNLTAYNLDVIFSVLKKNNIKENVRAEQLTLDNFIEIANALKLSL